MPPVSPELQVTLLEILSLDGLSASSQIVLLLSCERALFPPPSSEEYIAARLSLIQNFTEKFERYVIPCFVASGHIDEKRESENLQCRYCKYRFISLGLPPPPLLRHFHGLGQSTTC